MNSGWGPRTLACFASLPNGEGLTVNGGCGREATKHRPTLNTHAMMSWQCFLDIKSKTPGMDRAVRGEGWENMANRHQQMVAPKHNLRPATCDQAPSPTTASRLSRS